MEHMDAFNPVIIPKRRDGKLSHKQLMECIDKGRKKAFVIEERRKNTVDRRKW